MKKNKIKKFIWWFINCEREDFFDDEEKKDENKNELDLDYIDDEEEKIENTK